jgi:hypothetical protein
MRDQPRRNFYPCHIENKPFDDALRIFQAKSTRFKATVGAPRAGRHFMLQLPTGRYAIVTNYDHFPYSLEFSLEIKEHGSRKPVVHMRDLWFVLNPLGLPLPDKSNDGVLRWLPPEA